MTDLERAQDLRRSLEAAIHPAMRDCFEKCLAHLIAAARQEGAEQASGEIHALRKALHEETMRRIAALPANPPAWFYECMAQSRAFGTDAGWQHLRKHITEAENNLNPASYQQGMPCGDTDNCPDPVGCGFEMPPGERGRDG